MLKQELKNIKFWWKRLYYLTFKNNKTIRFDFPNREQPFLLGEYVYLENSIIYYHLGENIFLITDKTIVKHGS